MYGNVVRKGMSLRSTPSPSVVFTPNEDPDRGLLA